MRIVPVLGFTILVNVIFFLIGYSSSYIDFTGQDYYNDIVNSGVLYFSIGLICLLTIIIWLIFYFKNNAFRSYYPQSAKSLYSEWLLIYAIIFISILPFFSLNIGSSIKERSYTTKQEAIKAVETLNMVKILIPTEKTDYYKEYPDEEAYNRVRKGRYSDMDSAVILAEQQNVYYENYPNFAQLSLLNYNDYGYSIYISSDYNLNLRGVETVKEWLKRENREEVEHLMDDFLKLYSAQHLKTNLTKDIWMKLVYNPAKYPVGDFNLINIYDTEPKSSYYKQYPNNGSEYYLKYNELKNGYEKVFEAHMKPIFDPVVFLILLCVSGGFSLLIFSYRVTSGKSWLIAFISIGIFFFIDGFISIILGGSGIYMYNIILLILFGVELGNILSRNSSMRNKGRSSIYMNHLFWFIPAVPVILYFFLYCIVKDGCYDTTTIDGGIDNTAISCIWYHFMNDHVLEFVIGNICLTFVSMWFFVRYVLLRWKSLPEE